LAVGPRRETRDHLPSTSRFLKPCRPLPDSPLVSGVQNFGWERAGGEHSAVAQRAKKELLVKTGTITAMAWLCVPVLGNLRAMQLRFAVLYLRLEGHLARGDYSRQCVWEERATDRAKTANV